MKRAVSITIWVFLMPIALHASSVSGLRQILDEIKAGRVVIQNSSAAFLVVCKQLGAGQVQEQQNVRVIKPVASIRDADMINARVITAVSSGELLPVLKKEGEWFQVRLPDARSGWVHQEDVQQLYEDEYREGKSQKQDAERYQQGRLLAENFFRQLTGAFQETEQRITDFEDNYKSLPASGQRNAAALYEELKRERELIQLARAYANHYYQKLPPFQEIPPGMAVRSQTVGFDGTATVRFGSSAYESTGQISETTRNISLAGNITFNPQSRLALQLNHSNDVIRTPYTTTDLNALYSHEASGGTRVRTSVSFQDYGDEFLIQNSYRNLGAALNVEHPLNQSTKVLGEVQTQFKNYDTEGGNDLQGLQFNTQVDHRGNKTWMNAGLRGRLQSSEIAFLDYQRMIPNLRLTYRTDKGNFSVYAEGEQLVYGAAAENNNYNRVRVDLEHSASMNRTQFSVINWQFPNNENFDNLKFRILRQRSHRSAGRYVRSAAYAQYTFHTSDAGFLGNFLDFRYDRNFSSDNVYLDAGAFGRYWEDAGTEHRLSIFSRFGFKFSGIQIGPVVGADILIDPDDPDLKRVGNSFRAGVDGRGNLMIRQATIYSSVRYQQTILYTGVTTDGDSETRNPLTLEITAGARIPIARLFDIQFDLRYYSMDFDFPEISDTAPVQIQSGLRYLAGISYRF